MWKLFLDDERDVQKLYPAEFEEFTVARSFEDAVKLIELHGCPSFISFDNDLGATSGKDGIDLAKWLVEADLNEEITINRDFSFKVHSANCVAWARIAGLLNNYMVNKHGQDYLRTRSEQHWE